MRKSCNVFTLIRHFGPSLLAIFVPISLHAQGPEGPQFPSGYVSCAASLTGSLTTLLDKSLKTFRVAPPAEKVKALHLVADVAHDQGRTRALSEGELMQIGLLLKMTLEMSDSDLENFASELYLIALRLSSNTMTTKSPVFETHWQRFLSRIVNFRVEGYSPHRAAVYGTLAMTEVKKIPKAEDPSDPLQKAFEYLGDGWSEDFELTMHPTLIVIGATLKTNLHEETMSTLDCAMAGLVGLIEKSVIERKKALNQERFKSSYLWLVSQIDEVSVSPGLARYPRLAKKVVGLKNAVGCPGSNCSH